MDDVETGAASSFFKWLTILSRFFLLSPVRGFEKPSRSMIEAARSIPSPSDIEDARATIINGVAIIAHETIPRSTLHNASRITTPAIPITVLIAAVANLPSDKSRPVCMTTYSKYKRAGGHRASIKRIFTVFTFVTVKNERWGC